MTSIRSDRIEVTADAAGAELRSVKGRDGVEYLWQGDPAFWPRRSPLLFPVVGGLPGGTYSHAGKTYKLDNHGFARSRDFRLASSGADFMRYELSSDETSLAIYPFEFLLAVSYRAEDNRLSVGWEVENRGGEEMRFSIGAHPAFRAPLVPGEEREDYDLVFERAETVSRYFLGPDNCRDGRSAGFLEGSDRVALGAGLFKDGAIVLKEHRSRRLALCSRVSGRFVELSFPGFPYLGIWAPKDNERGSCPFVCLEPWYGIMPLAGSAQELSRKEGCLALAPGAVFKAGYTIAVA